MDCRVPAAESTLANWTDREAFRTDLDEQFTVTFVNHLQKTEQFSVKTLPKLAKFKAQNDLR